jgi:endo-1,4-beta-D-glucanase Y
MFLRSTLTIALATGTLVAAASEPAPARPFPQHTTYAPGTIRPSNFSQAQQDDDVLAFYQGWKSAYLVLASASPAQYRVAFGRQAGEHAVTVSEGQGYGMVIVATMAGADPGAHAIFDGLWAYARAHPSVIDSRLMAWRVPTASGDQGDSAFDGDADMAYALLLAAAQWGSAGAVNYAAEATTLITGIKESTIGADSHLPLLGDWVNDTTDYNEFQTRSSDFIFGHFRAYGRATGDAVWETVIAATQSAVAGIQKRYSRTTGLLPDFIVPLRRGAFVPRPAPANFLEGIDDGHFYYNAARDPWRIGTDALLNGDATSTAQLKKLSAWIEKKTHGDPQKIRADYTVSGVPIAAGNYFTTVFAAPFGVAAMTNAGQQTWLNSIYASVRTVHEDYFEDSVNLLCLLVMTGNFWDPTLAN